MSAFLSARIILGYLGECPHPHLANKCPSHTLSTQFKGYQLRKLAVIGSCRSHRYWQQAESLYTNSDVWLSYLWDRQAYKCFSMGWSRLKWVHKSLMWDERENYRLLVDFKVLKRVCIILLGWSEQSRYKASLKSHLWEDETCFLHKLFILRQFSTTKVPTVNTLGIFFMCCINTCSIFDVGHFIIGWKINLPRHVTCLR